MASATSWYLSVGNKVDTIDAKLEAVSIAMSEWQRLEHMSFEELEAKRNSFKTPWDVGDKYKVSVQLGEQGYFKDGICHPKSGEYAAEDSTCFQNTIMTVYSKADDGSNSSELTTRTLPLASSDSFYNKKEIDGKIEEVKAELRKFGGSVVYYAGGGENSYEFSIGAPAPKSERQLRNDCCVEMGKGDTRYCGSIWGRYCNESELQLWFKRKYGYDYPSFIGIYIPSGGDTGGGSGD